MKQQQIAIERIKDELVFRRLIAGIDRTPDRTGARNAEHAGKGDRIVAGQNSDFLSGRNAGTGEATRDPIAQALHVGVAQVLPVHGQAGRVRPEGSALIQIVDQPHGSPPRKKRAGGAIARATRLDQL